ncbi:MAG: hypothetical protein CSYNP_01753 [Syntrophus sp. SKADARSKE-3]|nr:hypothetical protein [Syntrophus sp. SKADARSKE-3]
MNRVSLSVNRRQFQCLILFSLLFGLLALTGCANTPLYTIDIRYTPTKVPAAPDAAVKKKVFTVANFIDSRTIDDPRKLGYVLMPDGQKVFVLPKTVMAKEAVAAGMRDYLYKAGYSVSGVRPNWDLRDETIGANWGDIVIGGTINKLEIICDDSQTLSPVKKYSAIINLGFTLADGAAKKTVYKTSVEGSASLTDVSTSTEKLAGQLESQLNGVLSDVIEKFFTGSEFQQQLKKVTAK